MTGVRETVRQHARKAIAVLAGLLPVLLALSAPAAALVLELPGEHGARDTKVLVFNNQPGPSGRQDDGTSDAAVMWTHDRGEGGFYYDVYRHRRGDGRSFARLGTCHVNVSGGTVTVTGLDGAPCSRNSKYNYVVFRDNGLANYEEYYYLVALRSETADAAAVANSLNKFAVAPAFPPTQTRHGNFSEYSNACNACHGLHSSKHRKLLKAPTVTDLCGTCHDGTGSKYDEVRGRVRTGDSWSNSAYAAAGPFGDRLRAGSGVVATSTHNVLRSANGLEIDGSNALGGSASIWQAPGSGWLKELRGSNDVPMDLGIANDWGSQLVCSSCHEPHNRAKNYRILRGAINDRLNILVRGVSEVDRGFNETTMDRGDWGGGDVDSPVLRRAMYTKFLSGGNSVLSFNDPAVEDRAFACADGACSALAADAEDLDGDGNYTEAKARAYCELANGQQGTPNYATDPASPTGVRCKVDRPLGGVTTFCSACHRGFMGSEAWVRRFGAADGSTSGYDAGTMTFGDIPGTYSRKLGGGTVEDNDGSVAYTGLWETVLCSGCSGPAGSATETVSSQADAAATLSFNGNQVTVLATFGPDRGVVNVLLDDVWVDQIDLYGPSRVDQQVIYTWSGAGGSHTIKLINTGDKNMSSSGTAVGVDAFQVAPETFTYSSLGDVVGEHKHPVALPATRAYREGRLAEGVLASDGEVCSLRKALTDPACANVGQGRLVDPVVPLEGIGTGKWQHTGSFSGSGYAQNAVVCLTCHVAHGSGAERVEVAYGNGTLNDAQVFPCTGYDGDGVCGNDAGESLGPALTARRDRVTGYLWNRMGDATRAEDALAYVCENTDGDPTCGNTPGERLVAKQDGAADGQFAGQAWDFTAPVFDAAGRKLERWEAQPAYLPPDQANWTQLGVSSALARFNPLASVCYRCHSATRNGAVAP